MSHSSKVTQTMPIARNSSAKVSLKNKPILKTKKNSSIKKQNINIAPVSNCEQETMSKLFSNNENFNQNNNKLISINYQTLPTCIVDQPTNPLAIHKKSYSIKRNILSHENDSSIYNISHQDSSLVRNTKRIRHSITANFFCISDTPSACKKSNSKSFIKTNSLKRTGVYAESSQSDLEMPFVSLSKSTIEPENIVISKTARKLSKPCPTKISSLPSKNNRVFENELVAKRTRISRKKILSAANDHISYSIENSNTVCDRNIASTPIYSDTPIIPETSINYPFESDTLIFSKSTSTTRNKPILLAFTDKLCKKSKISLKKMNLISGDDSSICSKFKSSANLRNISTKILFNDEKKSCIQNLKNSCNKDHIKEENFAYAEKVTAFQNNKKSINNFKNSSDDSNNQSDKDSKSTHEKTCLEKNKTPSINFKNPNTKTINESDENPELKVIKSRVNNKRTIPANFKSFSEGSSNEFDENDKLKNTKACLENEKTRLLNFKNPSDEPSNEVDRNDELKTTKYCQKTQKNFPTDSKSPCDEFSYNFDQNLRPQNAGSCIDNGKLHSPTKESFHNDSLHQQILISTSAKTSNSKKEDTISTGTSVIYSNTHNHKASSKMPSGTTFPADAPSNNLTNPINLNNTSNLDDRFSFPFPVKKSVKKTSSENQPNIKIDEIHFNTLKSNKSKNCKNIKNNQGLQIRKYLGRNLASIVQKIPENLDKIALGHKAKPLKSCLKTPEKTGLTKKTKVVSLNEQTLENTWSNWGIKTVAFIPYDYRGPNKSFIDTYNSFKLTKGNSPKWSNYYKACEDTSRQWGDTIANQLEDLEEPLGYNFGCLKRRPLANTRVRWADEISIATYEAMEELKDNYEIPGLPESEDRFVSNGPFKDEFDEVMALDQLIKVEHEDEEPYTFVANRPVVIIRYRLLLGEDGEWRRRGRIQKIGPECTIPPKSKNFVMANHL